RPGQSQADWRAELDQAIGLAAEHLSLYQLTIEPNTAFEGAVRRGELRPPHEEHAAAPFEVTRERLPAAGPPASPSSNPAPHRPPAGRRLPPQSRLLALWRLCRYRPRRAWPADARPQTARHSSASGAGGLVGRGRARRPRHPSARRSAAGRADRRMADDGAQA